VTGDAEKSEKAEQRVRCKEVEAGVRFIGLGRQWEEGRWLAAVEFYSSSLSKVFNREEEMGRRRFSGGSEGGMTALRFGSSRMEEGGSRQRTARRCGRRGGGADGSRRWEPMEAGGGSRWKPEVGADGETKMGRVTKWAESQGGCSINSFIVLNFKQDFRFKNQRFEILLN
jgi:hypothetical protein